VMSGNFTRFIVKVRASGRMLMRTSRGDC
jgi:hypothetical protein